MGSAEETQNLQDNDHSSWISNVYQQSILSLCCLQYFIGFCFLPYCSELPLFYTYIHMFTQLYYTFLSATIPDKTHESCHCECQLTEHWWAEKGSIPWKGRKAVTAQQTLQNHLVTDDYWPALLSRLLLLTALVAIQSLWWVLMTRQKF